MRLPISLPCRPSSPPPASVGVALLRRLVASVMPTGGMRHAACAPRGSGSSCAPIPTARAFSQPLAFSAPRPSCRCGRRSDSGSARSPSRWAKRANASRSPPLRSPSPNATSAPPHHDTDVPPAQCGVEVAGQLGPVLYSYDAPRVRRLVAPPSVPTLGGAAVTLLGSDFGASPFPSNGRSGTLPRCCKAGCAQGD
jgi:hypothetical protein